MAEFDLLIKGRRVGTSRMSFGHTEMSLSVEPLFRSIGSSGGDFGVSRESVWQQVHFSGEREINPWDLCHALVADGMGLLESDVEFAEPDLLQSWLHVKRPGQVFDAVDCARAEPQSRDYPCGKSDGWYHGVDYGQFEEAIAKVRSGRGGERLVRIAHLDTGYDPQHKTRPGYLPHPLERSWVDGGGNSAVDQTQGLFTNRGHGTGTLSILTAAMPMAEVVPLRVADRVVLFRNSAVAKALDYVHQCNRDPDKADFHIVTMSMGGLASRAWKDAINALYDQGVFIVAAAGNNFNNLPTRNIVYPARFNRVVAACGIMADRNPYADLGDWRMAGNTGPERVMGTAMAAWTPNVPWARMGCDSIIDQDGNGTSAATPQIAAAAALYLHRHWDAFQNTGRFPEPWMRVEAIRRALFGKAQRVDSRCGHGALKASDALEQPPTAENLTKTPADQLRFPLLNLLLGYAINGSASPVGQKMAMLELEALQLSQSREVELLLLDPENPPSSPRQLQRIAQALAGSGTGEQGISRNLRQLLLHGLAPEDPVDGSEGGSETFGGGGSGGGGPGGGGPGGRPTDPMADERRKHAVNPLPPRPSRLSLRVFAFDPSMGARLATLALNETVLNLDWEPLQPGPVGEYLEVVDVDPPSQSAYAPVDLHHGHLLATHGLPPSEGLPQFHQQMVYAVCMETIGHFERALGRVAMWSPRRVKLANGKIQEQFVRRLRVHPHAMRQANAFYSPDRKALLFGYFTEPEGLADGLLPGGLVFTCLSHDIIAHETTHALLDGLHRRYVEASNPDVRAFHEAFADIVALFQHFTIPEALTDAIARTRGDLSGRNIIGALAVQFGVATGRHGALRDYIGSFAGDGQWQPHKPSRDDYRNATETHSRGAVLVAALFDAYLKTYAMRTRDLVRLASGGTGILPEGEIPEDLVRRLAREAGKLAGQWLTICIRALDYCPPVDITFGDYLRAMITADRDAVPDDDRSYRTALVEAFRERGIHAHGIRYLSAANLIWERPPDLLQKLKLGIDGLNPQWDRRSDREAAWNKARKNAAMLHGKLTNLNGWQLQLLGLVPPGSSVTVSGDGISLQGTAGGIEVHSVRPARRATFDGGNQTDWVINITQSVRFNGGQPVHRGGCTLLIDAGEGHEIRYLIRKRVDRYTDVPQGVQEAGFGLRNSYFGVKSTESEPFALLHQRH